MLWLLGGVVALVAVGVALAAARDSFDRFPEVDDTPQPTLVPRAGPSTARTFARRVDCGGMSLDIPVSAPTSVRSRYATARRAGRHAVRPVRGDDHHGARPRDRRPPHRRCRDLRSGAALTITVEWQLVTDEYVIGSLTSGFDAGGMSCSIDRPDDLTSAG